MIGKMENEAAMVERHLDILQRVIENEPIGIVKLANESGHEQHEVRYSLRVLEEDGIIEPSQQGAITTEQAEEFVNGLDDRLTTLVDKLSAMKLDKHSEDDP